MPRLFGTDGVRGIANVDLTPDLALALGRAAGGVLAGSGRPVVVGRDTRLSGPMLEAALVAGLCSAGADVRLAEIIPTPAIAFLTIDERAAAGAAISASHNPVDDNGIKFFSELGMKIGSESESEIERAMEEGFSLPTGAEIGSAAPMEDAEGRYVAHLLASLDGPLDGFRVVLDCANGAAWKLGPEVFRAAGAEVIPINAVPDGSRINVDCGSTSLDGLRASVRDERAALGLALDGDADRVLAVDENGGTVDGDGLLGLLAFNMLEESRLKNDSIVATVMTNLGLRRSLEARGIEVLTAQVGDRYVADMMTETGAVLGGEQSGHVILAEHATTGDGLLTGLHVARIAAAAGRPFSEIAHFFEPFPQVLVNVRVARRDGLESAGGIWTRVRAAEEDLGDSGRVLVRASGTEPVVRVMVEAADPDTARRTADELARAVSEELA